MRATRSFAAPGVAAWGPRRGAHGTRSCRATTRGPCERRGVPDGHREFRKAAGQGPCAPREPPAGPRGYVLRGRRPPGFREVRRRPQRTTSIPKGGADFPRAGPHDTGSAPGGRQGRKSTATGGSRQRFPAPVPAAGTGSSRLPATAPTACDAPVSGFRHVAWWAAPVVPARRGAALGQARKLARMPITTVMPIIAPKTRRSFFWPPWGLGSSTGMCVVYGASRRGPARGPVRWPGPGRDGAVRPPWRGVRPRSCGSGPPGCRR